MSSFEDVVSKDVVDNLVIKSINQEPVFNVNVLLPINALDAVIMKVMSHHDVH